MEREPVTAENFVQELDDLTAMVYLELVAELVYENLFALAITQYRLLASYFEQPWKHPEIWVPLLNRRLGFGDYPCHTCGQDSDKYADAGKDGWECETCYESGIED